MSEESRLEKLNRLGYLDNETTEALRVIDSKIIEKQSEQIRELKGYLSDLLLG